MQTDILSYDKYLVQFSGGKDSSAVFLYLLEEGVSLNKIELWHQDIDGTVIVWRNAVHNNLQLLSLFCPCFRSASLFAMERRRIPTGTLAQECTHGPNLLRTYGWYGGLQRWETR